MNGTGGLYGKVTCDETGQAKITLYIRDTTCPSNSRFSGTAVGAGDGQACLVTGPNLIASVTVNCGSVIQPTLEEITNTDTSASTPSDASFFSYQDNPSNTGVLTSSLSIVSLVLAIVLALSLQY